MTSNEGARRIIDQEQPRDWCGRRKAFFFLAVALCILCALAAAWVNTLLTVVLRLSWGFVLTPCCLAPEEMRCVGRWPSAPAPWAPPLTIGALGILLIPWEIVRYFAYRRGMTRLFFFLSIVMALAWLPWSGVWWEVFSPGSVGLPELPRDVRFFLADLDLQSLNFKSSWQWLQLIPLAILLDLGVTAGNRYSHHGALFSPEGTKRLATVRVAVWTILFLVFAYELAILAIDHYLFAFSWDRLEYFPARNAAIFLLLIFAVSKSWFYHRGEGSWRGKLPGCAVGAELAARATLRIGGVALLLATMGILLRISMAPFPLDVAVDPRGQATVVCPFLASRELSLGLTIWLLGTVVGELAKLGGFLSGATGLWWRALVLQLGVALPLGLAVAWRWFHAGLQDWQVDAQSQALLAEGLRTYDAVLVPWALVVVAFLSLLLLEVGGNPEGGGRGCSSSGNLLQRTVFGPLGAALRVQSLPPGRGAGERAKQAGGEG